MSELATDSQNSFDIVGAIVPSMKTLRLREVSQGKEHS